MPEMADRRSMVRSRAVASPTRAPPGFDSALYAVSSPSFESAELISVTSVVMVSTAASVSRDTVTVTGAADSALSSMVTPATRSVTVFDPRETVSAPAPLPTVSSASSPCSMIVVDDKLAIVLEVVNAAALPDSPALMTNLEVVASTMSTLAFTPASSALICWATPSRVVEASAVRRGRCRRWSR